MNESLQTQKVESMISTSVLSRIHPADFFDAFCCKLTIEEEISPTVVLVSMFTDFPRWVGALMKLRNCLVKPLGLKGGKGPDAVELHQVITGFAAAHPDMAENEAVLTANDKHLRFYASVIIQPMGGNLKEVTVSTFVQFHNNLGRAYFFFIRPFHTIIVPAMLRRALKGMSDD